MASGNKVKEIPKYCECYRPICHRQRTT